MFNNTHVEKPYDHVVIRYQLLLAIFYFLIVAFWSVGITFHGAPDEATHFFLLEYMKTFHTLPGATEPSQLFVGPISGWPWHPGAFWYHGLPFPHVLGALVLPTVLAGSYQTTWVTWLSGRSTGCWAQYSSVLFFVLRTAQACIRNRQLSLRC